MRRRRRRRNSDVLGLGSTVKRPGRPAETRHCSRHGDSDAFGRPVDHQAPSTPPAVKRRHGRRFVRDSARPAHAGKGLGASQETRRRSRRCDWDAHRRHIGPPTRAATLWHCDAVATLLASTSHRDGTRNSGALTMGARRWRRARPRRDCLPRLSAQGSAWAGLGEGRRDCGDWRRSAGLVGRSLGRP